MHWGGWEGCIGDGGKGAVGRALRVHWGWSSCDKINGSYSVSRKVCDLI